MAGKRLMGFGVLVAIVGSFLMAGPPRRAAAADPDPMKLLYECKAACDKVKDFTAVFSKHEQMHGELKPKETVEMKFRAKPFSVYMIWQNPHKGREVIYCDGKNKNQDTKRNWRPRDHAQGRGCHCLYFWP